MDTYTDVQKRRAANELARVRGISVDKARELVATYGVGHFINQIGAVAWDAPYNDVSVHSVTNEGEQT